MTDRVDPFAEPAHIAPIREAVRALCTRFPDPYWRDLDARREYPAEFVRALTEAGWLAALIPREFGGLGSASSEAAAILEEVNRAEATPVPRTPRCTSWARCCGTASRSRSAATCRAIAAGELRLQAFGVTEPDAGSETTRIETIAERDGDRYVINGQKVFISRVAALGPDAAARPHRRRYDEADGQDRGLSLFLVDLREAGRGAIEIRPARHDDEPRHHASCSSTTSRCRPRTSSARKGEGFRHIIDGWNAERILIAAECVGDGHWFIERAPAYASERVRSSAGRSAPTRASSSRSRQAYAHVEAADLMRDKAAAALRRRYALRRGGEHGQAACLPRRAGRPPTPASTRTAATASPPSTTSSASSARRASISVAPDQQQPGAGLHRPARPRFAPLLLSLAARRTALAAKPH